MKKLFKAIRWLKEQYRILAEKKFTTIAGTLVYFLIMSVTPFAFWLTLLFGRLNIGSERLLDLPIFESVKNILLYIRDEANKATTGASVFFIAATLYSATSFFYHMRKSGEIIYDYRRQKHGFLVRLGALLLLFVVMFVSIASILVFTGGSFIFSRLFPRWLEVTADYFLLIVVSFGIALLLNVYICPYRSKLRKLFPGTLITVAAWAVALVGFAGYLKIGNTGRLYGALSAIIVFMLWLYVLMICFVAGVVFNSKRISSRESKKL